MGKTEHLLGIVMRFVSFVYPYKLSLKLAGLRNLLYTLWIRQFMGHVGEQSRLHYPIRLQGENIRNVLIGSQTVIGAYSVLGCRRCHPATDASTSGIVIGDKCCIGEYNHISACKKITIGNGLLTGRFVYIGDNSHGGLSWDEAGLPPLERNLTSKGEIRIGDNVWIGDKATILGGVTIGDNVIIGAGAVVTHDIPSHCIAVGIPAKVVRQLK